MTVKHDVKYLIKLSDNYDLKLAQAKLLEIEFKKIYASMSKQERVDYHEIQLERVAEELS